MLDSSSGVGWMSFLGFPRKFLVPAARPLIGSRTELPDGEGTLAVGVC